MSKQSKKTATGSALITGASGSIGSAIAKHLAKEGFDIALQYNNNFPKNTFETIQELGTTCDVFKADLSQNGFEFELLETVQAKLGPPTVLINCAAIQDVAPLKNMSNSQFDAMIDTNVGAVFALSRAFAEQLRNNPTDNANIVNISSIEGSRPAYGHAHYATSKAAVEMLTKSMALEYGEIGLRVNAIAPGLIEREGIEVDWPEGVARWNKSCPLGRMGKPEDVAHAVGFLVSKKASFINGSVLTLDGGMSVNPGW